jgi:hypothetical protein
VTEAQSLQSVYIVGADDRIEVVDDGWREFLLANSGRRRPHDVLGRSLWAYVHGPVVVQAYRALHHVVRAGRVVRFPYRCDAPRVRREFEMTMRPLANGRIEYSTVTLREVPRLAIRLLDADAPRGLPTLVMCSWCKRVRLGDWVEIEDAVIRAPLLDEALEPQLVHGMCPACADHLQSQLGVGGGAADFMGGSP